MPDSHKKGIITIAFDDAYQDTYIHAIRYLTGLNIKSTVAVPSSFIGNIFENRRIVGLRELKDIIDSGHEIASHTISHPNLLSLSSKDRKAAIYEIEKSKKELQGLLSCRVESFVFPYIKKNQSRALRLKAEAHYKSARITRNLPCFNKIPLKDPYSIEGFSVMKKHSLSYLNRQIDLAGKKHLWLMEVFHLVGKKNTLSAHRPKPYRYFMHIDDFRKHVQYIISKNILVLTQKEAVKILSTN
ncbi:MAG: hypothetical protein A2Z72_04275 [Omnitrophica bacterium RBG_13_46_9]|nr:MAG: hypothetical protein A2Z72_04275 [Omnitrophica bacterium RBG_13_46_9]